MRWKIVPILLLPIVLGAETAPPSGARTGIDIARLRSNAPGWLMAESTGDDTAGRVVAEQAVWPMFYLHWMPLGDAGEAVSVDAARKAVEGLWKGLVIDEPLEGAPYSLPSHPAVVFETLTSHGERRTRYIVWSCPASGRLFVADTNVSLLANTPPELLEWQRDMARTVRCHADAAIDTFPHLTDRYEIPDVDIAYSHPRTWRPIELYRIQEEFGGTDLAAARHPGSTRDQGQDLTLAMDAYRRIYFTWEPAPDEPMSYEILRKRTEDFWRPIASNIMITETRSINNVWFADGILRMPIRPEDVPPTHMHKFRTWMWRQGDTLYFSAAHIGGVRFGRRKPGLPTEMWDANLEEMFRALAP